MQRRPLPPRDDHAFDNRHVVAAATLCSAITALRLADAGRQNVVELQARAA
jgi:hypothetical protein